MRFLVVGLGSIGRRHATNLASLVPDAQFTFVRRHAAVDEFTRHFGARVVAELDEVLDERFDLAVLATPSAAHIDVLPRLVATGWPLLVEKPIVTSVADCDRIASALDRAPDAVRVAGFNLRHVPSIRLLKELVADGALGRVVRASFVAGQWLPDWRPGTDHRSSYSADAGRGGGVELDLSHEYDLARWLFGELDVAFASGGRFSELGLRANDTAVAVLTPGRDQPPLVTVTLDYVSRRRVRRYEIVGDRGSLVWDLDGSLTLLSGEGVRHLDAGPDAFDVGASYVTMMRALVASDRGSGAAPELQSLRDGLASTKLAVRARDEGSRGR